MSSDVIIIIEDSDDEKEPCEEEISPTLQKYYELTQQYRGVVKKVLVKQDSLLEWRKCLNPFTNFGLNYHACETELINKLLPFNKEKLKESKECPATTQDMQATLEETLTIVTDTAIVPPTTNLNNDEVTSLNEKPDDVLLNNGSQVIINITSTSETTNESDPKSTNCINSHCSISTSGQVQASQLHNSETSGDISIANKEMVELFADGDIIEERVSKQNERVPYYLENFVFILNTATKSNENSLFDASDINIIERFHQLSVNAKKLYIRLYQRKKGWFRCNRITYPKIAEDLRPVFKELLDTGFLVNEDKLKDLDSLFALLSASETRSLAIDLQLTKKVNGKTKDEIIVLLKTHSKKQKTLFSYMKSNKNPMTMVLINKSKKYLGKCVQLNDGFSFVFVRCLTFFSLTVTHYEDIMYNAGANQLYHLLQVNNGDIKYPSYNLTKTKPLFADRQSFIQYTLAAEMEREFDSYVEKKLYDEAYKIYLKVKEKLVDLFQRLIENQQSSHKAMQPFLLCFTEEWLILRLSSKCVDILEKRKEYVEAVALIELLLAQNIYCQSGRGVLIERLALDYERYLKDPRKAMDCMEIALSDEHIRTGHRLSIHQRWKRLAKSINNKKLFVVKKIEIENITEPKEETINAQIAFDTSSARRAVFVTPSGNEKDSSFSHVEQHVILHYKENGYPEGLHGEGSTVTTMFMLLFWDIVFMDVSDVFFSEFQSSPLDMYRDDFYTNRKKEIDQRLHEIQRLKEQELREAIECSWGMNYGVSCVGVNWDLFQDSCTVADLAICIGSKALSGICELFCKDFRRRRGGFPDLIVWNAAEVKCKVIEVKGPGDKLSTKQMIWLDILRYLGMEAVTCHVRGIGAKRMRLK